VLNLHKAGVLPDVIAMQLDISNEEVIKIIRENSKRKQTASRNGDRPALGMFYLDAVVSIDNIIKSAQLEMWKSLQGGMEFSVSLEDAQDVLAKAAGTRVTFAILYIDIVGSTKLAMTLPVDKLAAIVRAFTHEMSLIVSAYGGFVLKYLGDAILAFFVVQDKSDPYIPCANAVHCGKSMIRAVKEGFNPLLNQEDYPELGVRVGIDIGEVVVVQYGWAADSITAVDGTHTMSKKPLHDIIGYTISIASKITGLADPNRVVVGQYVYDVLDGDEKKNFKQLSIPSEIWSYVSSKTGKPYDLYTNRVS
jgi:class 3 adenylate cyclase